jgi:hypothetical protein
MKFGQILPLLHEIVPTAFSSNGTWPVQVAEASDDFQRSEENKTALVSQLLTYEKPKTNF